MAWLLLMVLGACGARSGLDVDPGAGVDDAGPRDAGVPETCDGRDEDGDGRIDEDVPPMRCGVGACESSVSCVAGAFARCSPLTPAMESCNGRDDDCDGAMDEGLGFGPRGEVVELREEVGGGDECTSCRWAWDTTLVPIESGYLVMWRVGILGGSERPNFWGRRIDPAGRPLGPPELLGSEVLLHIFDIDSDARAPDALFEGTERRGTSDTTVWIRVRDDGTTEVTPRPYDLHPGCRAAAVGETVWTGERLVSVCWEDDALHVASLRRDGSDVINRSIPLPGASGGNVAVWDGQVGVRSFVVHDGGAVREVAFVVLDAQGQPTSGPRTVDLEYTTWARLIGTEAGWLYWVPQRGPTLWQLVSRDGDPLTALQPFDDLRRTSESPLVDVQVQDPASGLILNVWQSPRSEPDFDPHVEWIDSRGAIVRGWSGPVTPTPDAIVSPHAVIGDDGRVRVTWHGIRDDHSANPVYFLELGCVEP